MTLTASDRQTLKTLKQCGALEHLDPDRMGDAILIACGDCDRILEAIDWHRRLVSEALQRTARFQLICVNGGPLNLVYPWVRDEEAFRATQMFLMHQIRGSQILKQLQRIEMITHWPCGQAGMWELTLEKTLELAVQAISHVREEYPSLNISASLHVDDGEKNTLHFSPRTWQKAAPLTV